MPKATARDSCICWHNHMKNREQLFLYGRSHKFAVPGSEAPNERFVTTVVDLRSDI